MSDLRGKDKMVYKLYRTDKNCDGIYCIGVFSSDTAARAKMVEILNSEEIKPYYYRSWYDENGKITIDYGSHLDFFYIEAVK